jgi:hypothetical protein
MPLQMQLERCRLVCKAMQTPVHEEARLACIGKVLCVLCSATPALVLLGMR